LERSKKDSAHGLACSSGSCRSLVYHYIGV
jgi:hypothetical protein